MHSHRGASNRLAGFTLIEMSIVVAIIAIIIAGTISMGNSMIASAQQANTNNKLDEIETALLSFRLANNRLPCPTDATLTDIPANSSTFGYEAGYVTANSPTTSCTGGSPAANFSSPIASVGGTTVAEGAIPVRTLNLPDEFQVDGWGRKFAYAVWTPATGTNAFLTYGLNPTCGAITVSNAGGGYRTQAGVYMLISYGPDGHGGYLKSGTRYFMGSDNTAEQTNCHCNTTADTGTYLAQYVEQDPTQTTSTDPLSVFDDIVRFKERWQMQNAYDTYNPNGAACYQTTWVTDSGNNRVEQFNSSGSYVGQFGSGPNSGNSQFSSPWGIAVDSGGNLWVADVGNNRVQEFSNSGTWLQTIPASGCSGSSPPACPNSSSNGQFYSPAGITIDSSGNVWVMDYQNNRVEKFSSSGTWLQTVGSSGLVNGQFESPASMVIDGSGNLGIIRRLCGSAQVFCNRKWIIFALRSLRNPRCSLTLAFQ
jgi:prepilin-type N-terminal cleavage/methylation domain-containing protein